jgi:hypothetical protein
MSTRIQFTTNLSQQMAQVNEESSSFLNPIDLEGRVRIAWFNVTKPANTVFAADSLIALTKLPAGARIVSGTIRHGAMGTGATASAILVAKTGVAITTDTALQAAPHALATVGDKSFASTEANGSGYVCPVRESYLCLKVGTAWPSEGTVKTLSGFVQYVVD